MSSADESSDGSSSCCPPGSWPPLSPTACIDVKGSVVTVEPGGGATPLPVYTISPENGSGKGIIVFTDVWGFTDRIKGICDALASRGYHVVMPDCFRGETKGTQPDFLAWIQRYPYDGVVSRDVEASLDLLRSKGASSVGAIGFCWGAWVLAKASSLGVPLRCGVGAHPSMKIERVAFSGDEVSMLDAAQMPLLLLPAGNDEENLKPGSAIVEDLIKKGGKSVEFPNMVHGWVTRGDTSIAEVRKDGEAALTMALDFFRDNL